MTNKPLFFDVPETMICKKCGESKSKDSFLCANTTWKRDMSLKCNECRSKKRKIDQDFFTRKRQAIVQSPETHKMCTGICSNILPFSKFKDNNKTCIKCCEKRNKQFAKRKDDAIKAKQMYPESQLCIGCYHLYPTEDFVTDIKQKNGNYCKECRARTFERQDVVADKLLEMKQNSKCVDCGETNIKLLEYDHINPEEKYCNVGNCRSIKKLESESSICQVRCIICHIRRSKQQFSYKLNETKPGYSYIDECKREIGGCQLCGWYDEDLLEALHFDHIDQSTKLNGVSRLASLSQDTEVIKEEIRKCRLTCAHCHKLHTIEQLGYYMYTGDRRAARQEKINKIKTI
jgi:hypothetical protein